MVSRGARVDVVPWNHQLDQVRNAFTESGLINSVTEFIFQSIFSSDWTENRLNNEFSQFSVKIQGLNLAWSLYDSVNFLTAFSPDSVNVVRPLGGHPQTLKSPLLDATETREFLEKQNKKCVLLGGVIVGFALHASQWLGSDLILSGPLKFNCL